MQYICGYCHKRKAAFLLILGLLIIAINLLTILEIYLPSLSIFLFNMIIIILMPSKNIFSKLVAALYAVLLLLLIQGKWIEFDFLPQVKALLEENSSIFYWFSVGHPHAIRFLIAYPGYFISNFYNIGLNAGFSYYCVVIFTALYLVIAETIVRIKECKKHFIREVKIITALTPLLILPFIMNGRLIAAYLGFSILILIYVNLFNGKPVLRKIKLFSIGFLGLLLTMVSSGTMAVALMYVFFLTFLLNYKRIKQKRFMKQAGCVLLLISPIIYKVLMYFWQMVLKNVNFYGGGVGGFFNMLNHGAGRYFYITGPWSIVILIIAVVLLALNIMVIKKAMLKAYRYIPILAGINISLYGLLFGFAAGSMMIPPLIIMALSYF
jgi:hypothetical protein